MGMGREARPPPLPLAIRKRAMKAVWKITSPPQAIPSPVTHVTNAPPIARRLYHRLPVDKEGQHIEEEGNVATSEELDKVPSREELDNQLNNPIPPRRS